MAQLVEHRHVGGRDFDSTRTDNSSVILNY